MIAKEPREILAHCWSCGFTAKEARSHLKPEMLDFFPLSLVEAQFGVWEAELDVFLSITENQKEASEPVEDFS